jgi:nucleoside-diphosphate-sugar epimerase
MDLDFTEIEGHQILVTGASGLIGSEVLNRLTQAQAKGNKLKIFALSKSLNYSLKHPEVTYLTGDLADMNFTNSIQQFDSIIHAAGYGQPGKFLRDPFKTISLNTTATEMLLSKAKQRFLFISTSEIYSGSSVTPCSEEQVGSTNTKHPRAAYIESKKVGETLSYLANKELGIQSNIARLALAYGPGARLDDERVLNQLIIRSLKEKELRLKGSGNGIRTYCYISDAVDLLLQIFLLGSGDIYNVGGYSRITITELASLIAKLTGVEFVPETSQIVDYSPAEVSLDISKVLELGGKNSFITLEEGLANTIDWYRKLLEGKNKDGE